MGRHGVTFHEVKLAISNLQGQQKAPTVDNVRHVLGTGSKSTIAKYLREWKAQNDISNPIEAELPEALLALIRGLWQNLRDNANDEIQKHKTLAEEKMLTMEATVIEANQTLSQIKKMHDDLNIAHTQQTLQLKDTEKSLQAAINNHVKAAEKIDALNNKNTENKAENERLHQLLQHVQNNLAHYQKATQELRREQTLLLENQRQAFEQKLYDAKQQCDVLQHKCLQSEAQNTQLISHVATLEKNHADQSKRIETLEAKIHHLSIQHETTQVQLQDARALAQKLVEENDVLKQTSFSLSIEHKTLQHELSQAQQSKASCDQMIYQLRHQVEVLSHEKSYLEGQLNQVFAKT